MKTSDRSSATPSSRITKTSLDQGFSIRRFVQGDIDAPMGTTFLPGEADETRTLERGSYPHSVMSMLGVLTSKSEIDGRQKTENPIDSRNARLTQCPTGIDSRSVESEDPPGHIQEAHEDRETYGDLRSTGAYSKIQPVEENANAVLECRPCGAPNVSRSERLPEDVSESSEYDFYSFDDDLSEVHIPSPEGILESSSFFYPEWYTIDDLFKDPLFVISDQRSDVFPWTKKYYILYAEKPRLWRRLTISATIKSLASNRASMFTADISHDSEQQDIALPHVIWELTMKYLSQTNHFMSVTNLSLFLKENERGSLSHDQTKSGFREDCMEVSSSGEDQILHDIEDLGCKQFLESEMITQSRKSSACFIVLVESRTCVERKAPFVSSGLRGANGFQGFFDDLKFLKSLGGCSGVAEFVGVVLNDARTQLRSYMYEYPALGTVMSLFLGAQSKREIVPWSVRESWARQLVEAVANVHSSKGSMVGGLSWLDEIGVRADGTIVLTCLRASQRYFNRGRGMLAPELRGIPGTSSQALTKMANFRTEIFALGHILWRIAEHRTNTASCFCARNACVSRPRYRCAADHANSIELPPCNAEVPPYYNAIIKHCRARHPRDRRAARQLREMFPSAGNRETFSPEIIDGLKKYARCPAMTIYCDECGSSDMGVHYHCNHCYKSNFDLCTVCHADGISCWDPEHRLLKRVITDETNFKVRVVPE